MALELIQKLDRLDNLIRTKSTGTPKELASRLAVSERTVYNLVEIVKGLGGPVAYSKRYRSYYYIEDGHLYFGFRRENED